MTGDESADVLNFQSSHPTFPHQSMKYESFTEPQFESYRRLGQHVVETLLMGNEGTPRYEDSMAALSVEAFRRTAAAELFESFVNKWSKEIPKSTEGSLKL